MKKNLFTLILLACSYGSFSQVSYKSEIYKSNAYVPPLDLNLLREVNKERQSNYYQSFKIYQAKFKTTLKLIKTLSHSNKNIVIKEYNRLVDILNTYDVSDHRVKTYLDNHLQYLEVIIDVAMEKDISLPNDIFVKKGF